MNLYKKIVKIFYGINPKILAAIAGAGGFLILAAVAFAFFQIFVPANPLSNETIIYSAPKGLGDDEIAAQLQKLGIIRNSDFFRFYVVASLQHGKLQAGSYNISARMPIYQIVNKMASGDVIREKLVIPEGWDARDIGKYLESKNVCKKNDFVELAGRDYSNIFDFLKGNPEGIGVEGYLYPDTYEISDGETCEDIIKLMLSNFGKKITQDIKDKMAEQKKSLFETITMASIIEKEVRTLEDKKIVSGILWKRISVGMPMQVDATINYITEKNDPGVAIKDIKIDSPYNTYMYKGLPKGPISNPGAESILAALSPKNTKYWFYLSDATGRTIFSATLRQHSQASVLYLKY